MKFGIFDRDPNHMKVDDDQESFQKFLPTDLSLQQFDAALETETPFQSCLNVY